MDCFIKLYDIRINALADNYDEKLAENPDSWCRKDKIIQSKITVHKFATGSIEF